MSETNFTLNDFKKILAYDPETGVFTRTVQRMKFMPGEVAGYTNHGYIRIKVFNKSFGAHRLAWLFTYGAWPVGEIDHINGIQSDNRVCNLREVSHAQNCENKRKARADNKVGFLGVSPSGKKWRAQIQVNGKKKAIGTYATPELAHEAYLEKKRSLHVACTI